MTPKREAIVGSLLWVKGVLGCLFTARYITQREEIAFSFFILLMILGFYLIWCAATDYFADDFHEDIKNGYNDTGKDGDRKV